MEDYLVLISFCVNSSLPRKRYYKGFLRGAVQIAKDEGVRGLYKGYANKDNYSLKYC